ncbi:Aqp4, partial [Symbiodinium sp. CCMP2456]
DVGEEQMKVFHRDVSLVACLAEFVGMTLFVIIGCGSAMGIQGSGSSGGSGSDGDSTSGETTSMIPGWVLMVALVFGLSITTLAYSIGHYSGGHLNCAVTLGLVLTGNCHALQGLFNFGSQMMGSILGAAILCAIFPPELDMTKTLGANSVGLKWNWWNALIGELAAEDVDASAGPGYWRSMWIFWVGPLLGACLAAAVYKAMLMLDAVHEEHTLKHHPGYKRRQTLIQHATESTSAPAAREAAVGGPVLLGSKHGQKEGKDTARASEVLQESSV